MSINISINSLPDVNLSSISVAASLRRSAAINANPVFARDSVARGEEASPYELYSPATVAAKPAAKQPISAWHNMASNEVAAKNKELKAIAANTDYTGMSDVEIYQSIYDLYADAFGDDFLDAHRYGVAAPISASPYGSYWTELYSHFGVENTDEVNRRRLYGDMSTEEIQNVIIAKYPADGQRTIRDVMSMARDFAEIGTEGIALTMQAYQLSWLWGNGEGPTPERFKEWEANLDSPIDSGAVLAHYNGLRSTGYGGITLDTGALLSRIFNIELGIDGYFDLDEFWEKD